MLFFQKITMGQFELGVRFAVELHPKSKPTFQILIKYDESYQNGDTNIFSDNYQTLKLKLVFVVEI